VTGAAFGRPPFRVPASVVDELLDDVAALGLVEERLLELTALESEDLGFERRHHLLDRVEPDADDTLDLVVDHRLLAGLEEPPLVDQFGAGDQRALARVPR
jgi:hypothetical protein